MITLHKTLTADSGISVAAHSIAKFEIGPDADAITLHVESWPTAEAKAAGNGPVDRRAIRIELSQLPTCAAVIDEAVAAATASGSLMGAVREGSPPAPLDLAKARKLAQIDAAWAAADASEFEHAGQVIKCNAEAREHIKCIHGYVLANDAFPAGWPGGWKSRGGFVALTTVEQWKAFYSSMIAQGLANFAKAQQLKTQTNAATTVDAVRAISWDSL